MYKYKCKCNEKEIFPVARFLQGLDLPLLLELAWKDVPQGLIASDLRLGLQCSIGTWFPTLYGVIFIMAWELGGTATTWHDMI